MLLLAGESRGLPFRWGVGRVTRNQQSRQSQPGLAGL